jgi:hypothetical protein
VGKLLAAILASYPTSLNAALKTVPKIPSGALNIFDVRGRSIDAFLKDLCWRWERRVTALFAISCVAAFIWSALQTRAVHNALIDTFPPEFKDNLTEKFAFHVIALSPATPLSVQADYLNSQMVGCFGILCFSLAFFSAGEVFGGWLALGAFFMSAISIVKAWKTYKENCNRKLARDDQEEL